MFDQSQGGSQGAAPGSFPPWSGPDLNGMPASAMNQSQPSQGQEGQTSSSAVDWTAGLDSTFLQEGSRPSMPLSLSSRPEIRDQFNSGGGRVGGVMPHFENKDHARPLPPRDSGSQTNDFSLGSSSASQIGSLSSPSVTLGATSSPFDTTSDSHYNFFGVRYPIVTAPTPTRPTFSYGILQDAPEAPPSRMDLSALPLAMLRGFGYGQEGCVDNQVAFSSITSGPSQQSPTQTTANASASPMGELWRSPSLTLSGSESSSRTLFGVFGDTSSSPALNSQALDMGTEKQSISRLEAEKQVTNQDVATKPRLPRRSPEEATASQASRARGGTMSSIESAPSQAARLPPTTSSPRIVPVSQDSENCSSSALIPGRRQAGNGARPSAGARPSREQVPAEAWERYKLTIRTLYLEERKPLKEVMSIMAARFGFHATPKMYKTRFSQWGFVKNNTEEEVKRLLSMKFQRDAEGKVSEFVRNGRVVDLGTYLKRKGVTEYDLVDFALPAELPAHIKCRTPSPPLFLKSPDLLRAQELVVGNTRKVFLHYQQVEAESDVEIQWQSTMLWGASSSEILLEANSFFEKGDADQGGRCLMRAFKQLEVDLQSVTPQAIMELIQGLINRDPGMLTALCKYLAAYSATNFERLHPLRQIFGCLYEVLQKHGASTLSEVLAISVAGIAEELEAIYGRCHPYVAQTWIDLAMFHNQINLDGLQKSVSELRGLLEQSQRQDGATSNEAVVLQFIVMQMQYCSSPRSEATKQMVQDLWNLIRRMGRMYPIRDARPNVYCYQSFINAEPRTKRCLRRYCAGAVIIEEQLGVHLQAYFNGVLHITEGAIEGAVVVKRHDHRDANRPSDSSV